MKLHRWEDIRRAAPFSPSTLLRRADVILALPPAAPHIRRVDGVGFVVQRFVLPLELCRPQNRTRHAQPWMMGKLKRDVFACLAAQAGPYARLEPLEGRPMVRCIRFSSVEPDAMNDGFKVALDTLCVSPPPVTKTGKLRKRAPAMRLGFFQDDAPRFIDLHSWWERAPKGEGFGLIEIWSGA